MRDWVAWHAAYDDPDSGLSARLASVCRQLAAGIDRVPPGPVRLVSLCAGQERDVLRVLLDHPRRAEVTALLVEADAGNAAAASERAAAARLAHVEVRQADASQPAAFADALPADVLLLCGIFGNISDADIEHTARAAPALCRPGATVIWTRHRREPDLTPQIRAWFTSAGFEEAVFDPLPAGGSVGAGCLRGQPPGALPAGPLFTFRDTGAAAPPGTGRA